MRFEIPFYRKCIKCFSDKEEAESFIIQCHFDGNKHFKTILREDGYEVYYYDVSPKRRVKQMTVQEVIVKNNIEDFSLTFTNVLGIRIENPNSNIIADMTVKSVEIDWVSQSAKISVVTR